ncbi:MAG: hypothetical protein KDC95_17215, partial [Planctomycetes bacterium]|nr:hypothetical protein [Planctomycetota bacterium]
MSLSILTATLGACLLALGSLAPIAPAQSCATVLDLETTSAVWSSYPSEFATMSGAAYFVARVDDYRSELWKTDGTTAGTQRVAVLPGRGVGGTVTGMTVADIGAGPRLW